MMADIFQPFVTNILTFWVVIHSDGPTVTFPPAAQAAASIQPDEDYDGTKINGYHHPDMCTGRNACRLQKLCDRF